MNNNEPLYRGGCGHTDAEVEEAAVGCIVVTIVFVVAVIVFLAVSFSCERLSVPLQEKKEYCSFPHVQLKNN